MLSDAILKVKTEMDSNKNNPYIQVVGEFILQHLDKNPLDAEKILDKEKTITNSLGEMRKAAEKKKVGNCAVLTDQEGFEIVLKYFGIDKAPVIKQAAQVYNQPVSNQTKASGIDFDIRLNDLLD